jgi:hypothetical protein
VCLGIALDSSQGLKLAKQFELEELPFLSCMYVDEDSDFHYLGLLESDQRTSEGIINMLTTSLDQLESIGTKIREQKLRAKQEESEEEDEGE